MEYPECEKLAEARDQIFLLQDFLDWLNSEGIYLADYKEGGNYLSLVNAPIHELFHRFLGIDSSKLEEERKKIVDSFRKED